ncbi:chromo domain-containing protein [Aspergillus luchuensis]|uniref:Uncharacterized protein n=1 Tax=Aspergillus kawachii TaxID=1069201 RepID=A0A7R7WK33_ASPKA|nr:uncharacterized protein AKAW2_80200S [Aspergillus luchuensis]BCS04399.1 hypothetical protein AKAW2_80200S [Aspergillus luchuensis]BCS15987.1 hypothetical protein ALUC_80194S [Aspergillus luchuensis]GAA84004.1 heterochromatin protein [Aspergillus luchuensis IFO 4308]
MPPPLPDISDDESSSGESIPYNDARSTKDATKADDEDEDEDEEEEDVYAVEKIMNHDWAKKGDLLLQVKWQGYDDPADMTWEPEENLLEGAKDIVEEYFRVLGGRPEKPQPQTKKRKSMGRPPKSVPEKTPEPKRRRKSRAETTTESPEKEQADEGESDDTSTWVPSSRNWEKEVDTVETIIRQPGTSNLLAFISWKNGRKSKVSLEMCYDKCPKKMLRFYESHLVFKEG